MMATEGRTLCDGIPSEGWDFLPGQDSIPSKSSNGDIAGIGIAIGFSAAAYIVFILVITYYLCGFVDDPFTTRLDEGIIAFVWRWRTSRPSRAWEPFLRKVILLYSDTQLVTGLALLGSLYPQLTEGLESYYWQMAVYLVWLSSSTHLTSITILRQYFRNHENIRLWRVLLMLLMAIVLVVALLPTGDRFWIVDDKGHFLGGVPAICHYYRLATPGDFSVRYNQGFTMMVSLLILAFGYITRIVKLHGKATNFCHKIFRLKPSAFVKRKLDAVEHHRNELDRSVRRSVQYIILESLFVAGRAALDAWESMLWEIIWPSMVLIWGSLHLFLARSQNLWKIRWQTAVYEKIPEREDDKDWTYAQVFEVIILFLPILSAGEAFIEHRREVKLGLHDDDHHAPSQRSLEKTGRDSEMTTLAEHVQDRSAEAAPSQNVKDGQPRQGPTPPSSSCLNLPSSHTQDYYNRWGFRCLLALIVCLSVGIAVFATGISILYDANWAYKAVLAGVAFGSAMAILWTVVMLIWSQNRSVLEEILKIRSVRGIRLLDCIEMAFGGVAFAGMLTAHGLFMASFGPSSSV